MTNQTNTKDVIELNFLQSVPAILRTIDFEAIGYRQTDFGLSTSLFGLLLKEVPRAKHDAKSLDYLGIKITENKMLPDDTMVIMRNGEIVKIVKFEKESEDGLD